jgi:hypothetical protein
MVTLSVEQLNYLASWRDTASLVKDDAFSFACEAYFHSHSHAPELRFMTFWFILERLFLRDADELAYRLSANVAAFLEQSGEKRYDLFRKVKRLYKIRSAVAHGRGLGDATAIAEADEIVIRCLRRVVENRRRPTQDDLFKLLFGAP